MAIVGIVEFGAVLLCMNTMLTTSLVSMLYDPRSSHLKTEDIGGGASYTACPNSQLRLHHI